MSTILQQAFDKNALLLCQGFSPTFIEPATSLTFTGLLPPTVRQELPDVEGNKHNILHYTNLSVLYHATRRIPFLSAYNIDGKTKKTGIKRAGSFKPDPRIQPELQLSKKGFYDLRTDITEFEIGHMAANDEMAWGNDAQLKAYQTFHFTNSVPQAERLNTGIWKSLESYIIKEAASQKNNKRISVFTGPVIQSTDPRYTKDPDFLIPLLFYKVIVFPTPDGIRSTAFMMSHEQRMIEQQMFVSRPEEMLESGEGVGLVQFNDFKYRKVFQVDLKMIEDLTGMRFRWRNVRRIDMPNRKNQIGVIRNIRDAQDAQDASDLLEVFSPVKRPQTIIVDDDLTPGEMKKQSFHLNVKLA